MRQAASVRQTQAGAAAAAPSPLFHLPSLPPSQAVLREELGADREVLASMILLEPSAVVESCAHDLQKRVTRLVEVRLRPWGKAGRRCEGGRPRRARRG